MFFLNGKRLSSFTIVRNTQEVGIEHQSHKGKNSALHLLSVSSVLIGADACDNVWHNAACHEHSDLLTN